MSTIHIEQINISPDRIRKKFDEDKLADLRDDIQVKGLFHAIVLNGCDLVIGERRLRAMTMLYEDGHAIYHDGEFLTHGFVPYTDLADLDPITRREAELTENTVRDDLTWQERVAAIEELHTLRKAQNPAQRVKDTAREMDGLLEDKNASRSIGDALILAAHLDDPVVATAPDQRTAKKLLTRKLESEFEAELSRQKITTGITRNLIHADFRNVMPELEPDFDCIIADPPYGIDADTVFGSMSQLDHAYKDDYTTSITLYEQIAKCSWYNTKPEAHLYIFCDPFYFHALHVMYEQIGYWVHRSPLIWHKGSTGLLPYPDHMPRRTYECILFAIKGKKKATIVTTDVIDAAPIYNKTHAAQKPVELYAQLLSRSCRPGDIVLDPCCGSGTIFPAAKRCGVTAWGIEQDEAVYLTAVARISENG